MGPLPFFLLRMLLGFFALALTMVSWRASAVLTFCLLFDFLGMVINAAPPNLFWNQAIGHLVVGAVLGTVVSIARGRFTSEGRVVVEAGAIHDPIRKKTYVAGLGRGATVNGKALKTTQTANLRDAFLVTGFSYNAGIELKKDIMTLYEVAIRCKGIRGDGSAALDMALVAEGVYDASWDYGLKPWDVAAGGLIIAEAGGTVVNYPGEPTDSFDVERPGLICGAPVIVKALSELIRQV